MEVDPRADKALYLQLADVLREDIAAGRIGAGEQLPSESVLIDQHGVSRGTARKAISVLRNEGVVLVEHGRGAFVRPADAATFSWGAGAGEGPVGVREAFEAACAVQGVAASVREVGGDPPQAPPVSLPKRVPRELLLLFGDGRPVALARRWGRDAPSGDRVAVSVGARMPTREERRLLQLDDGTPVVIQERTLTSGGRPVEHSTVILSSSRARMTFEVGETA